MNIESLRYFLALVETNSISKAAERLFLSPQGLSYAISSLEQELNVPLFIRTSKGVLLTKYGKSIYDDACALVCQDDSLRRRIDTLLLEEKRQLNIAVAYSFNCALAPLLSKDFRQQHPETRIYVEEFPSVEINTMLLSEHFHFAFTFDGHPRSDITTLPLARDGWCLVLNREHPLAHRSSVRFADLTGDNLALANHNYQDFEYFATLFSRQELPFNVSLAFGSGDSSVVCFLEQNAGVMISATYLARELIRHPQLTFLPIEEELTSYTTCLQYKSGIELPAYALGAMEHIQKESAIWQDFLQQALPF